MLGLVKAVDQRLKRVLKNCSWGWNSKRPGAIKPLLRYRSFVGLKESV
jgi:hypothetical protein